MPAVAGPMRLAPELHPAIRLLALVALGACLFRYRVPALILVFVLLAAAIARGGADGLAGLGRALRRIRWLLLSIVVIYLWIAPEHSGRGGWAMPSLSDLELALRRAGVLVVLVAAVEWLRQTTPAAQTAAAIAQILGPLSRAGLDVDRFAARVALTLEAVPATAEVVGRAAGGVTIKKRQLGGWAEAAAALIREIETEAPAGHEAAALPVLGRPRLADWFVLAATVAVLYGLSLLPV
jgi:energy-coupling factor transport system permease protein